MRSASNKCEYGSVHNELLQMAKQYVDGARITVHMQASLLQCLSISADWEATARTLSLCCQRESNSVSDEHALAAGRSLENA